MAFLQFPLFSLLYYFVAPQSLTVELHAGDLITLELLSLEIAILDSIKESMLFSSHLHRDNLVLECLNLQ